MLMYSGESLGLVVMSRATQQSSQAQWQEIRKCRLWMDNRECIHCNRAQDEVRKLEVHHIVPVDEGGSDELENLRTLCLRCHRFLHAITESDEFIPPERLAGKDLPEPTEEPEASADLADVRKPAEWMIAADDRILEIVRVEGNMTPIALSRDGLVGRVDIGRKWASNRCNDLTKYGLLKRVGKGLYGITDLGHGYLEAEIDASELEPRDG